MSLTLQERIQAFTSLGDEIENFVDRANNFSGMQLAEKQDEAWAEVITASYNANAWFLPHHQIFALQQIRNWLKKSVLENWVKDYHFPDRPTLKTVAVINAGNIPFVGFHDFICVLLSGQKYIGKLSKQDEFGLPFLAELLVKIEPAFRSKISFTSEQIKNFHAVIATGSNNSARYFEHYFGKYPHIIRGHRNGIAILTGDETIDDLQAMAEDVFMYYGLGCRSVSMVFVPENYDFSNLFNAFDCFAYYQDHSKYFNNYTYFKTINLLSGAECLDSGWLLLVRSNSMHSPVGVLNFQTFSDITNVKEYIEINSNQIQCVVTKNPYIHERISFGQSQKPLINEYADDVDVMDFLSKI